MDNRTAKKLEAKCFCGSVHFTLEVASANLPLPVYLCHCSRCRFLSGSPCIFHFTVPDGASVEYVGASGEDKMTAYIYKGARSAWRFCSTCGCHISSRDLSDGSHFLSPSTFSGCGPGDFQVTEHVYSKSARDGGLSRILTHVGGRLLGEWNPPDDLPDAKIVESQPEFGDDGIGRLRAECHCGGVSFTIQRPPQEMVQDEYWGKYVSPIDETKWLATLDVCDDCRLFNGTHVVGWAFVPRILCDPPLGQDLMIGTSKTFSSSEGVLRSFCGTCGATVFYSCDDRCPSDERHVVDLATGILRAPEGPMAREWLTWRARISFLKSGKRFDKELAESLADGMNSWAVDAEGKPVDFVIA